MKTHDPAGDRPGVEPNVKPLKAPALSQKELAELHEATTKHIRTVGRVMHAGLMWLKVARLQNPDGLVPIPGTAATVRLPAVETHLAYTVISRSELTAKVLVEHAAEDETLLRWLVRINRWFEGGELSQLIGDHVVSAAATVGVGGGLVGMFLPQDIVDQVEQENAELRHQVAVLTAQLAGAPGPGVDERGAGNHAI